MIGNRDPRTPSEIQIDTGRNINNKESSFRWNSRNWLAIGAAVLMVAALLCLPVPENR